jgi:FMN phosphatase YigB (HAD superfamily)
MVAANAEGRLAPKLVSCDVLGTLSTCAPARTLPSNRSKAIAAPRTSTSRPRESGLKSATIAHYWEPYRRYRDICRLSWAETCAAFKRRGCASLIERYFEAFGRFARFADVSATLERLADRYRLAIVSNIDD